MEEYRKYEPLWGGWYIRELLGEGGFGKVYRIERQEYGHVWKAALKVITMPQNRSEVDSIASETSGPDGVRTYLEGIVNSIVNECVTMSRFKGNSYIVSYEDHMVIPHEDSLGWDILIRMELLEPLNHYTSTFELKRADVIKMGIDLCKGLEMCHYLDIIHRDIKPENIFLSEQGSFKLGDFGVARTLEKSSAFLSRKGTPSYMAPELYKGEPSDKGVDIYSLGILLYRFMNQKRLPFMPSYPHQITYSDKETALKLRLQGQPLPSPVNADPALARIILKACAYRPSERYQSARAMRDDLEKLQRTVSAPETAKDQIEAEDLTIGMTEYVEAAVKPKRIPYRVIRKAAGASGLLLACCLLIIRAANGRFVESAPGPPTERAMMSDTAALLKEQGISGKILDLQLLDDNRIDKFQTYSATCQVTVESAEDKDTCTALLIYDLEDGTWKLNSRSKIQNPF